MELFEHTNLGEHAIKLYHDGMLIVYETPTGGDCILLEAGQTCMLFAFLEAHAATFQGEETETAGIDPYSRELLCPTDDRRSPTEHAVQLFLDGKLIIIEGTLACFDLNKQEVTSLYNFLITHREAFQKNEEGTKGASNRRAG
jgi:hypothetical protein